MLSAIEALCGVIPCQHRETNGLPYGFEKILSKDNRRIVRLLSKGLCKGSCRGATEGLFYDKVLILQSLRHFLTKMPPPFTQGRRMYTMLLATEALCHIEKASPSGRGGGVADGEGVVQCARRLFCKSSYPLFLLTLKAQKKKLTKRKRRQESFALCGARLRASP